MCKFKSVIIMKDRAFISDYDHHTKMLEELGIEDNFDKAETKYVRAELIAPNNDMFSPIETWNFNIDQDLLPDWFVEEIDRDRMIEVVKEWAKEHIFIDKSNFSIDNSKCYLKNCEGVICYNSTVEAYGSSTVEAYGSSTVDAWDSSMVNAHDSSMVNAFESSMVEAYDSATVNALDSSTVKAWNSSTINAYNSSTVMAYGSSTVSAYGTCTVKAYESSTIEAWNSTTVEAWDSSTVRAYGSSSVKACGNY